MISFIHGCNVVAVEELQMLPAPSVSARAAVLMCADNNQVLYSKKPNEQLPMASTTKIMTSLLAIEEMELNNREVTITDEMVRVEGSSMGLLPGNIVDLYALAQGMLMCSGNDAANSAAFAICGSKQEFAKKMNEKAKQIGMNNTLFVTPSGLDEGGHHSTAYDMALLGSYAMENKSFADIVSQKCMKVCFIKPQQTCSFANHNRLLKMYKPCIGIKTGFTEKAGRCLVSCAEKNGTKLIAVTLNAPNDWNDHVSLFEYGFSMVKSVKFDDSNFKKTIPLVGGNNQSISVVGTSSDNVTIKTEDVDKIKRYVEIDKFAYAPIKSGEVVGKVVYKVGDTVIAKNNLTVSNDEDKLVVNKSLWSKICDFFGNMF